MSPMKRNSIIIAVVATSAIVGGAYFTTKTSDSRSASETASEATEPGSESTLSAVEGSVENTVSVSAIAPETSTADAAPIANTPESVTPESVGPTAGAGSPAKTVDAVGAIKPKDIALPSADSASVADKTSNGCVRFTFRHKAMSGHPDQRRCSKHRNLVSFGTGKLPAGINWKSVCLRVDGTPTPFQPTSNGLVFGPVAGPDSTVTVRYCRGQARCADDCALPRDPFFEAIGAAPGKPLAGVPTTALAQWDPSDAEVDSDAAAELEAELREHAAPVHGLTLFKEWSQTARLDGCAKVASVR